MHPEAELVQMLILNLVVLSRVGSNPTLPSVFLSVMYLKQKQSF